MPPTTIAVKALGQFLRLLRQLPAEEHAWFSTQARAILRDIRKHVQNGGSSTRLIDEAHFNEPNRLIEKSPIGSSKKSPRNAHSILDPGFSRFWAEYPRKQDKKDAEKSWNKLQPNQELQEQILAAVRAQKTWVNWTQDEGRYIPYAKTWLNRAQWLDEPQAHRSQAERLWQEGADEKKRK